MAIFKYDPLPLKDVEETQEKQHPWARTIKDVYSHRIKHAHNSIGNPLYPGKKEKQPGKNRIHFTVIGDRVTKEFTYCSNLVTGLYKYRWKNFYVPVIRGCNTLEWPEILNELKLRFKGIHFCLQSSVAVLFNNVVIGGEKELQQLVETKLFYYLCLDYYNEGVAEFARFIRSTSRPFAYMHVSIDDKHIGTLIYMLYADIVPYTCENFLRLCKETKGGYGGTPVHRIVKDGWIQCGGFGLKSTPLSCENFVIAFDRRGVLAMANDGRDDDCSTQFFVLLQPAPWMNHKYVAFGQLIEGAATLEEIERVTTWYESPTSKIILYRSGILNIDCHGIRINKEADQYIDGHIEDLNSLAKVIWEHLLEKTFLQAQLRELERLRALEGEGTEASSQNGEPAEPAKTLEKKSDENHEFDVEEIELKEEEDGVSYTAHQSLKSDSQDVETHRPYYIPLTDVPYPGDVESNFDLKRFLKGDYCLQSDLSYTKGQLSEFPLKLWEDSSPSSSSTSEELSLGSEEQLEKDTYIKANAERVSFAGGVIKHITAEEKKNAQNVQRESTVTDEKLRKIKLASAQYEKRQKNIKRVSMGGRAALEPGETKRMIKRRQTGYIRSRDLEKVFNVNKYNDDDDDDDDDDDEPSGKATRFDQEDSSGGAWRPLARRLTTYVKSTHVDDDDDDNDDDDDDDVEIVDVVEEESPSKPKESVLLRLYDEVDVDDERGPTLKNYIPTAEMQHKNLLVLTQYTPFFEANESRHQYKRNSSEKKPDDSFEHVVYLRHGHMSRKISNDYVNTIEMEKIYKPHSIRTVEYAKKRPTISVSDYQLQNLRYQEQLKRKANLGSW